ncbi:restriction endonuclease subunit S [Shimazuella alba]|uniref:Type I restriction modification DNA specificity domain-containing protein n=1 Tax=Shimazuella alba TaxID=2690964 RepID=A0A6I4VXS9_9BACL|nr:restriction endonuclease subunit S [Shimazuella alba]MXQ54775.1 hypothetical protein [Shimazuella alba]
MSFEEWKEVRLGDICEVTDCVNKTAPTVNYKTPYKMLRTTNIRNGQINSDNVKYVTEDIYTKWTRRSTPIIDDVILTREAPMGEIGIIKDDSNYFLGQRLVQLRANSEIVTPNFLYFAMRSPFVQNQIYAFEGSGSVVSHMRVPDVMKLKLKIPGLEKQLVLGNFLRNIEDKIYLNNQINQKLEEMAQAIFRSWFIDFEPFQEFVETELGRIPKGWEVHQLKDLIDFKYGKPLKKENREPGAYPVFGSNGQVDVHSNYLVEGPGIIIGRKGNPGTVNLTLDNFFPIDTTFYVDFKQKESSIYYYYFTLSFQNLKDLSADSAVPGLNRNVALKNKIILPPQTVLDRFDQIIDVFFKTLKNNKIESQTLAKLRDTLLPKLMSGELRIPSESIEGGVTV